MTLERVLDEAVDAEAPTIDSGLTRWLLYLAAVVAVAYAFLDGLRTIAEFDFGWQMAMARWIVQHRLIPSVDVLSYTAAGQPWIYPVGSELMFYGTFLIGGFALISWLAAAACAGVTALMLRRGSLVTAALVILAVPLVATRTTARAEMFTVLLFTATLSLVWQQHETGKAKLWLLPILMAAWVNLHPGFIAGLGLLGGYVGVEALELLWPEQRAAALARLRRSWPWLLATAAATLINPWGWKVFEVIARQEAAMGTHSQLILEWAPIPLNWTRLISGLSPRDPDGFYVLLLVALIVVLIAILRRQVGAAIFVGAAACLPLRHMRFTALFAIVVVLVGGSVLTSLVNDLKSRFAKIRLQTIAAVVLVVPLMLLAAIRSRDRWTNDFYLSGTNLVSFGTGLSWWFPERAAAFFEREELPGRVFNAAEEGGYLSFRLGPNFRDYIDSRAIPFGTDAMLRASRLKATSPDSPLWREEVERYDINVLLIPIGRFSALQFFPMLKQFCESDLWSPVYLDQVSVIFLRRRRETEDLIRRLEINCSTAPVPSAPEPGTGTKAFNQWANSAAVLHALGRDPEALVATNRALSIVPNSGYLHFLRGHMFQDAGNLAAAEQDYLQATRMEPNLIAPWSALAAFYQDRGRMVESTDAWEHAADASRWPWDPLVSLGYADLQAQKPKEALAAFDRAANSLPAHYDLMIDNSVLANIAHGRSRSYLYLGDLRRAILFDEQAARLLPDPDLWLQLATLYDRAGRFQEANQVRAQAMALGQQR